MPSATRRPASSIAGDMDGTEAEPWERQPGESTKAYSAFVAYRDIGPRRSYRQIPAVHGTVSVLWRWGDRWKWTARATAWDDERRRIEQEAARQEVDDMRRRHATVANVAIVKAAQRLQTIEPAELSPRDAAALLDLGVKIERLSRGDPTQIHELQGERERTTIPAGPSGAAIMALLRDRPGLAAFADELDDAAAATDQ